MKPIYKKLIVLLFVIFVIVLISRAIKKAKLNSAKKANVKTSNLNPSIDYSAQALKMFNALSRTIWTRSERDSRDETLSEYLRYNDDEFKHIYNLFNSSYITNKETLRDWVLDEWMGYTNIDDQIIYRMDYLNLA